MESGLRHAAIRIIRNQFIQDVSSSEAIGFFPVKSIFRIPVGGTGVARNFDWGIRGAKMENVATFSFGDVITMMSL